MKSAAKRRVFALLTALVAYALLEAAGYALFYLKKRQWPYPFALQNFYGEVRLYMADHPYLPYLATRGVSGRVEFNSLGDRGPEPETPKRRTRVLCYGGSTTFDGSHDWDKTWPGVLQELLGRERFEVINAAQNGATSADSLVNLALIHADIEPDLVLLYEGTNDLESSYYPGFRADYAHRRKDIGGNPYPVFRRLPRWLNLSAYYVVLRWYLEGPSGDLHALYTRHGRSYDFVNGPFGLPTFRRNLLHVEAIAAAHGAKVVLGTFQYYQPWADGYFGKAFGDAWRRGSDAQNEIVRALARERPGIFLAEVAGSFAPSPETMTDFCHLSEAGNRRIAEAFHEGVQAALGKG